MLRENRTLRSIGPATLVSARRRPELLIAQPKLQSDTFGSAASPEIEVAYRLKAVVHGVKGAGAHQFISMVV